MHAHTKNVLLVAGIASLLCCGCSHTAVSIKNSNTEKWFEPTALESIGRGRATLTFSQILAFEHIYLSGKIDQSVIVDFLIAQRAPVVERPEFWVELINDADVSEEFRVYCLRLFFLRHLRIGDSPGKLASIGGLEGWFSESTVVSIARASALPLEPALDTGYFAYAPGFPKPWGFGAYFQTSRNIDAQYLLQLMNGGEIDDSVEIVDITVN